jgi:uncharacterized protein (DUF2336 family)
MPRIQTSKYAQLLTIEDFNALQQDQQPDSRAAIAKKIGVHFEESEPESVEYHIASEIAFYLQKDNNRVVRIALAESLQENQSAPKQLLLLLAMDHEDEVAIPILRESPILNDLDLKMLLPKIDKENRLVAVAERKFLSVTVCSMLVERNIENVVVALLANESAIIDDEIIVQIAHKHARSKPVLSRMMKRMPLPANAVNHMVKMQQQIGSQENIAPKEIRSFTALDRAMLKEDTLGLMFLGEQPDVETCKKRILQLEKQQKISVTLLLVAMCLGHRTFFLTYMARNTNLPIERIMELSRGGIAEFDLILNKSGISPSLYPLMQHIYFDMASLIENDVPVGTEAFFKQMVQSLIKAERKGINFATTIGKPVAKALKETFKK